MDTGKLFVVYRESNEKKAAKLRWAGGGAQRPVLRITEPKKTGAQVRQKSTSYIVVILVLGGLDLSKQIRNYCKYPKNVFNI